MRKKCVASCSAKTNQKAFFEKLMHFNMKNSFLSSHFECKDPSLTDSRVGGITTGKYDKIDIQLSIWGFEKKEVIVI